MNINVNLFYDEAVELLQFIENILSDIQTETKDKEKIGELFRAFHTLKGSAGIFGFDEIVSITHKAEDLLDMIRDEKLKFNSNLYLLFIDVRDIIETLVDIVVDKAILSTDVKQSIKKLENRLLKEIQVGKLVVPKKNIKPKVKAKTIVKEIKKIKKILVVDDSSMIRNLASKTAESNGYNVITACDGQDGIEKLKNNNIDLIFSDVNMPQMGGLDMVEHIKEDSKYEFLPIVMLTTEKKDTLKQRGKTLGVKAWLVKPFNKNKFLVALEKLLG